MRVARWFDSWVQQGPFTRSDVAIYRILFALMMLVYAPHLRTLATYPDSLYNPPPGPFMLLSGFPPEPVLITIEIVMFLLLTATLVGLYTTFSSIALTVILIVGYGLTFSVGHIVHLIALAIVPAVMAFARWGDTLSIDGLRRQRATGTTRLPDRPAVPVPDAAARPLPSHPLPAQPPTSQTLTSQPQWPLRFLALAIGVAFCTAFVPKLLGGWLSISSQATYGFQVQRDFVDSGFHWLSSALVGIHVPALWEGLDWFTLLLEGSVILCVLSWRSWRIVIAVLTLFHLSIGLSLGIFFAGNVIAYGAFVSWGRLPLPAVRLPARAEAIVARGAIPIVAVAGVLFWLVVDSSDSTPSVIARSIVAAGAVTGLAYLARQALRPFTRTASTAGAHPTEGAPSTDAKAKSVP
jgi:hypothetical protein